MKRRPAAAFALASTAIAAAIIVMVAVGCHPSGNVISADACRVWHESTDESVSRVEQQVRDLGISSRDYAAIYWELAEDQDLKESLAECARKGLLGTEIVLSLASSREDQTSESKALRSGPKQLEPTPTSAHEESSSPSFTY